MNKEDLNRTVKMVVLIIFVLVTFQWTPGAGYQTISHYELYQRINNITTVIETNIPHPTSKVSVEISEADLRLAIYYVRAVDNIGRKSSSSNEVKCDKECIDDYLQAGNITEIVIKEVERNL